MSILGKIQRTQPLILNLANFVTPQRVADVISFIGASPLMTSEIAELESLVEISDAVVVNIGTISESTYPLFLEACRLANQKAKPLILDPVAVNVPFRASIVKRLSQEVKFNIIRGNSAEIAWFADKKSLNKGIDALESNIDNEHARLAAKKTGAVIIETGKVDIISNGHEEMYVDTDSPLFKINADMKTFHNQKVYSATIVTGLTAQNTYGVQEILPTNKDFILAQFDSVFSDLEISAAKTGALFDTAQVEGVIQGLKKYKPKHLVVDPVMVAKGGAILLTKEAIDLIKDELLPLAELVTPNLEEAEVMTGYQITDENSLLSALHDIQKLGAKNVLIKGGHGQGELVRDYLLLTDGSVSTYDSKRLLTERTHGTGDNTFFLYYCSFSYRRKSERNHA